jgi:DNA-binding GntR family transcriptional regulator
VKALQRRTGIALWRQVADQIRQTVLTGLAANERLPAEAELATRFGVNRHTVRSAIAALEKEGILRAEQGRGTFLNDRKRLRYPIGRRTRFSSGLERSGPDPVGQAALERDPVRPASCRHRAVSSRRGTGHVNSRRSRPLTGFRSRQQHRGLTPAGLAKLLVSMQRPARSPPRWRARGQRLHPQDPPPWKPGMPAARISICSLSRPAPSCS